MPRANVLVTYAGWEELSERAQKLACDRFMHWLRNVFSEHNNRTLFSVVCGPARLMTFPCISFEKHIEGAWCLSLRAGSYVSWLEVTGLAHPMFMPDQMAKAETRRQIRAWFRASLADMREHQLARQIVRIMDGTHG